MYCIFSLDTGQSSLAELQGTDSQNSLYDNVKTDGMISGSCIPEHKIPEQTKCFQAADFVSQNGVTFSRKEENQI